MSRCKRCEGKGFVETWHGGSASWTPSLSQCPLRCDISAYSAEVQRRLSNPQHATERPVLKIRPSESKSAQIIPMLRVVDANQT